MTSRLLPKSEWPETLAGTELGSVIQYLNPMWDAVIVVEDEGRLVGCWGGLMRLHAEGVWVHPDYQRKTSVARHLWVQMTKLARSWGMGCVLTGAGSEDVSALLKKHQAVDLPPLYRLSLTKE
jgi:hypothetical protein